MDTFLKQMGDRMAKALEITATDMSSIRSGRATPALVENIKVSAYGGTSIMKVLEMATITTTDAKTILIQPYDVSTLQDIAKGIQEANSGLSPNVDGEVIRITIPPLSEERRKEYLKLAHAKGESGKVMVRQIRHDGMAHIRKISLDKTLNEDESKLWEKKLQELTDKKISELDGMLKNKEQELMEV